jgi:hypothetical protein
MRLEFRLLVIDDIPDTTGAAVGILDDYLQSKGFILNRCDAPDLSDAGLRQLARQEGRNFDLVIIDYNLGSTANLAAKLADEGVAGVFVADRRALGETLTGVANTIIGKAIDLSHMRGIAMAEVAEMDVMMEDVLERVFRVDDAQISKAAVRTLEKLLTTARTRVTRLEPIVVGQRILDVVSDRHLFTSAEKFMALRRVAKCLAEKPAAALALAYLQSYQADIIGNRNILAHAKQQTDEEGLVTLSSIKKGQPAVVIDDAWMVDFRGKLRSHREALTLVCAALDEYLTIVGAGDSKED